MLPSRYHRSKFIKLYYFPLLKFLYGRHLVIFSFLQDAFKVSFFRALLLCKLQSSHSMVLMLLPPRNFARLPCWYYWQQVKTYHHLNIFDGMMFMWVSLQYYNSTDSLKTCDSDWFITLQLCWYRPLSGVNLINTKFRILALLRIQVISFHYIHNFLFSFTFYFLFSITVAAVEIEPETIFILKLYRSTNHYTTEAAPDLRNFLHSFVFHTA